MSGSPSFLLGCYTGIRSAAHSWSNGRKLLCFLPSRKESFQFVIGKKWKRVLAITATMVSCVQLNVYVWSYFLSGYSVGSPSSLWKKYITRVVWSQGAASCLLIARLHALFKRAVTGRASWLFISASRKYSKYIRILMSLLLFPPACWWLLILRKHFRVNFWCCDLENPCRNIKMLRISKVLHLLLFFITYFSPLKWYPLSFFFKPNLVMF